jgi:hypothetical protein
MAVGGKVQGLELPNLRVSLRDDVSAKRSKTPLQMDGCDFRSDEETEEMLCRELSRDTDRSDEEIEIAMEHAGEP